jgi:hypothetical protein
MLQPHPTLTPRQALRRSRIWWLAMMAVQALVVIVVLSGIIPPPVPPHPPPPLWLVIGIFLAMISVAFHSRSQNYKAHWVKNAITPEGYFHAQFAIPLFLTIPSCYSAGFAQLHQQLLLGLTPSLVCLLLMVLMFPDGKPMQDHPIRL